MVSDKGRRNVLKWNLSYLSSNCYSTAAAELAEAAGATSATIQDVPAANLRIC